MKRLIQVCSILVALSIISGAVALPRLYGQERFSNNPATTLQGDITNSATSITVNSSATFPATGAFHALIDGEIITVTAISGTTWTITRGAEGSTAATHNDGAVIRLIVTAASLRSLMDYSINQGRLTTESGVCVSASDRTSQSTIYWTPCGLGGQIGIYVTTNEWVVFRPGELSLALSSLTSGKNYDVFVTCTSATACALSLSSAWTNDTTRADALAQQDGVDVLSSDHTKRFLGTLRTTSTTTTEDSGGGSTTNVGGKRFVWNHYNRVARDLSVIDTTSFWSYATDTWRQARATAGNQVEVVVGSAYTSTVEVTVVAIGAHTGSGSVRVGVGVDSTTTPSGLGTFVSWNAGSNTVGGTIMASYKGLPSLGYHYYAWLERGNGSVVSNFLGLNNDVQSGLTATIWN